MASNILKPLDLFINNGTRYLEENDGSNYLTLILTKESKNTLINFFKKWTKIKDLARSTSNNLDDYLHLKKTFELHDIIIAIL